jgi:putative SOS response-associated peptidase YedK
VGGRLVQDLSGAEVATLSATAPRVDAPGTRFNLTPGQELRVVSVERGRRVVSARRWGLVPRRASDPAIGARLINARAETLADSPAFRDAFCHHRCLVPVEAFYTWASRPEGKAPYAVRRHDGGLLALAGLAATWEGSAGERLETFAVITTAANALLHPLHPRMPAIVAPDDWDRWLDPGTTDLPGLRALLVPWPHDDLVAYPVGTRVNDARNDGPGLLEPVA